MEVILLERVDKLGNMGEVVTVKNGFGRNFLLPQGKALRSNKANLAKFETQRAALEARNAELRAEAQTEANKIDGHKFVVIRQASETGALYGSVSTRDVADQLKAEGFTIERKQIQLEQPIKELGLHEIGVVLHPEVTSTVIANVARSAEEAELQADGRSIADMRAEEEAAEAAEFDVQSLFDEDADIGDDIRNAGRGDEEAPQTGEEEDPQT
jgi:large subunit ribosomal protein L9